jgi:S1-C subfamily serine protease
MQTALIAMGSALAVAIVALVLVLLVPGARSGSEGRNLSLASTSTAATAAKTGADNTTKQVSSQSAVPVDSITPYTQDELDNINIYQRLNEAVVNITTQTVAYNWFLEPVPQDSGTGSGSIIDTRGYVLTNNHVIANAYKVFISLANDPKRYPGTVVGTDEENDLAVVKFTPPKNTQLKTIPYGNSGNLKVGQKVLAIGNPFGLERTLSVGVVSGLGRPIQEDQSTGYVIQNMIQVDASINPGNSGGPLLDTQGRMIGINSSIATTTGSSAGIGFAVPVDTAKRIVPQLIANGKVVRGRIDAILVPLTGQIVSYANLPISSGLLVSQVASGGNAAKAGIKGGTQAVRYGVRTTIYLGGDIITSINGKNVASISDYYSALEETKPGDKVSVTINRNGRTLTTSVTLVSEDDANS